MKFLSITKFLLIFILPFLLFLLAAQFAGFDNFFYNEKFLEYGVQENIPNASSLHEKVINFVSGKSSELPKEFNKRESEHLLDVKNEVWASKLALYAFIALFIALLVISGFILKINSYIVNFIGKVLLFGGFLTVIIAGLMFFFISSDFSTAFESFHKAFFDKGTYTFDPSKEMIVNLYPEKIFMDLGIKISKWVVISAVIMILLGMFLLLFKTKKIKRENRSFPQK